MRAICSKRTGTSSKAIRDARTSSGNDITIIASTTARQVKTMSMPTRCSGPPIGPRRPNNFRRISPVATGGMTSGSATIVSTTDLPYHRLRASSHAAATPNGRMSAAASAAVRTVSHTISQSDMRYLGESISSWMLCMSPELKAG